MTNTVVANIFFMKLTSFSGYISQFATNPTIKQVAEAFRLSHNTTPEHIKKLERLGYIEKKQNPED